MSTAQFAAMTRAQAEGFMPNAQPQPARKRLAELVAGRTVIDIGCGKAEEVELYDPGQYTGIDVSPQLVQCARERWPAYRFEVCSAQELQNRWPVGIMKAVLEHVPGNEAAAIYEAARRACGTLFVAWHTEPGAKERPSTYWGELGWMQQNRHRRDLFTGVTKREVCGAHVIWTVSGSE